MTGTQYKPPPLSEAQITAQVVGFLRAHGWLVYRMQRALVQGPSSTFVVGEPGVPDWQARTYVGKGQALVLWIEMKKRGARAKCKCMENIGTRRRCTYHDQKNWREQEERAGGVVWEVNDLDEFMAKYKQEFGWLHAGDRGRGQLDLLMGLKQ